MDVPELLNTDGGLPLPGFLNTSDSEGWLGVEGRVGAVIGVRGRGLEAAGGLMGELVARGEHS